MTRNTLPSGRHTGRSLQAVTQYSTIAQPASRGASRHLLAVAKREAEESRERNYSGAAGRNPTNAAPLPKPSQEFKRNKSKGAF
jgi:hypothetical protein